MSSSSLIIKVPRVRRAPNRYSPSPTTAHFSSSRTPKRTPKKKKETSTKARTTPKKKKTTTTTTTKPPPKKITKAKKKEKKKEKEAPTITTPSSPKKEKKGRKTNTPQRNLAPTSVWYSTAGIEVPPFNNKFTQAQIEEMESLVSPWYGVNDIIRRLKSVRKRSILDERGD